MTIVRVARGPRSSAGGGGSGFTANSGFTLSGSATDGGSVTIGRGAGGFGTKPNGVKPLLLWIPGLNTLTPHALSRTTSMPVDGSGNANPHFGSLLTNVVRTGSTRSYEINPDLAGDPNPAVLDGLPISSTDLYCCLIWRTNWNGSDAGPVQSVWNMKSHRWWDSSFSHDFKTGYGDSDPPTFTNDNMVVLYENTADFGNAGNENVGNSTDSTIPKNRWLFEEVESHQGSLDTANAVTKFWHDGQIRKTYTEISRTSGTYSSLYSLYHTHQFQNVPSGQGFKVYYDYFYLDDSKCRVYLSDQSSWSDAVTRGLELMVPTAWSDTSITVTCMQRAFASFSSKYIYVKTSDGTVYAPGSIN